MPRPQRDDVHPIIKVPDLREDTINAKKHISDGRSLVVWDQRHGPNQDSWITTFGERERRLAEHRKQAGVRMNEGLVMYLIEYCDVARTIPVFDDNREALVEDGYLTYQLKYVGCRVRMTRDEIAEGYGVTRQTVDANIKLMKEAGLIVNWGRGWLEFDCSLCWRGKRDVQIAYSKVQTVHPDHPTLGFKITDGTGSTACDY
jgi:hypothetical protein